ncbi:MAG: hypothetical protein RIS64_3479 [Bacteroidota bacterium]|jgi:Common central domain of tyrosinase/Secretion system C-terminal sorting domain
MKRNLLLRMALLPICCSLVLLCYGQGRRPDISTFTNAQQVELRNLIMDYLKSNMNPNPPANEPQRKYHIIAHHFDEIDAGHNFTKDFLDWHRSYIKGLEYFILSKGKTQFLPLPKWNPVNNIPDAFWGANAVLPQSDGFDPLIYQTPANNPNALANNFNFSRFFDPQNLCSYLSGAQTGNRCSVHPSQFPLPTTNVDAFARDLECEHNKIHVCIGGTMTNVRASPGAAIFWLWHSFVDDLYYDYQKKCQGFLSNLFMKDDANDVGNEPNLQTTQFWISDDIWVRNQADGFANQEHQNPEYTANRPVYVYVKVRNRGGLPSSPVDSINYKLFLYWSQASTGLNWPPPFNGVSLDPQLCNLPMGGVIPYTQAGITTNFQLIRSVDNPITDIHTRIPIQHYTIMEYAWQPPNPDNFITCFGTGWRHNHFCLLARIACTNCPNVNDTTSNLPNLSLNLKNSNNIILKNITLTNDVPGIADDTKDCVFVGNYTAQPMEHITLAIKTPTIEDAQLFQQAHIYLYLTPDIKQEWINNGRIGHGVVQLATEPLKVTEDNAWIGGLDFAPQELNELCVQVVGDDLGIRSKVTNPAKKTYTFDIVQYNGKDVIGGERYKVDLTKLQKNSIPTEKLVFVFPNPASNDLHFRVNDLLEREVTLTDGLGRIYHQQRFTQDLNIDISRYVSGIYFAKIFNYTTNSIQVEKIVVK